MSEAPVLVPIFPYAAEGGARPSSYFRQGNWESETKTFFDEKIAPQAKLMKQIAPQARFFWLNPDVYKIFLTESWEYPYYDSPSFLGLLRNSND